MKNILKIFSVLLIISLLAACEPEPTVFDVPVSTWNNLTSAQKQEVIQGYNERQMVAQENAPIESAIDAAGTILNNPAIMHNNN